MRKDLRMNIEDTLLSATLKNVKQSIYIEQVSQTPKEILWNQVVKDYHYLGYGKTIGPRRKYLIWLDDRLVSAISFKQGVYRSGSRDRFVGWNEEERKKFLPHVLDNNRFLILPWVRIKNLASFILALSIRAVRADWTLVYHKEPYLIETFVDQNRFAGTCYRAANWKYIGESSGYQKSGQEYHYHGNKKAVYVYVLNKHFKQYIAPKGKPHSQVHPRIPKPQRNYLEMVKMQTHRNIWHPDIINEAKIGDIMEDLPEIFEGIIAKYRPYFGRLENVQHGSNYVMGLLSQLQRKTIECIALEFGEKTQAVRNMQYFMKDASWKHPQALVEYQRSMGEKISMPGGMITIDESGNAKKGTESVGVKRQYCGNLGKVENCQVGVHIGYSNPEGAYALLGSRLFMPEAWFEDEYEDRRDDCLVPEDLEFKTKPEIAIELLHELEQLDCVSAQWVGVDALYGSSLSFLDAIPDKYWYFADVKCTNTVWREEPVFEVPPYGGKGRHPTKPIPNEKPEKVEKIANDDTIPWKAVKLGEGSKGPISAKVKCIRIFRAFPKGDGLYDVRPCWLLIRRLEDGDLRYSVSNAPEHIEESLLYQASLMRWPIEQSFRELKGLLGMDHLEARSWPAWHRHMLLVLIAYQILLEIRLMATVPIDDTDDNNDTVDQTNSDNDNNASLDTPDGNENGNEDSKVSGDSVEKRKEIPILSLQMCAVMVRHVFATVRFGATRGLELIKYHVRRNDAAFQSHRKTREAMRVQIEFG